MLFLFRYLLDFTVARLRKAALDRYLRGYPEIAVSTIQAILLLIV